MSKPKHIIRAILGLAWFIATGTLAQENSNNIPLVPITVQNANQLTPWIPVGQDGQQVPIWVTMTHGTLFTTEQSPAGDLIAVGSSSGLYLFDANNPHSEPIYATGLNRGINTLSFSPDGTKIIVQSNNFSAEPYLYNVAEGRFYPLAADPVLARYSDMQFSSDGATVFASAYNSSLYQIVSWNAETGRRISAREIPEISQFVADSSPRPATVRLIVTEDTFITARPLEIRDVSTQIVQTWNKNTFTRIKQMNLAASTFLYLPELNWLITSGSMNDYNGALIWDAATGDQILTISVEGSPYLSPDGTSINFIDQNRETVRVWDIATRQITREYPYEDDRNEKSIGEYFTDATDEVLFMPTGEQFVFVVNVPQTSAWMDGLQIWDTSAWLPQTTITVEKFIRDIALAPDGQSLAVAIGDWAEGDRLQLYDVATSAITATVEYAAPFESLAYSPDGEMLAVGRNQGFDLALYNPRTGSVIARYIETGVPNVVAFSPDGQLVASGNADRMLRVYNVATQEVLYAIEMAEPVTSLAFSPDGEVLAIADSLRFLDAQTGRNLVNPVPAMQGLSTAQAEDLATLRVEGTSEQLRAALDNGTFTRDDVIRYGEYTSSISSLAFSPDGSLLATISKKRLTLWDVGTGYSVWDQAIDAGTPHVAFHPDGNIIITSNNGLRLWVVNTGEDSDQDGFDDVLDGCPAHAGDRNGCPDSDSDGVNDLMDACPEETGTIAGCPDTDNDGVGDPDDSCPQEVGSIAASGCPDGDSDGVVDSEDLCPAQAGVVQFGGCPDTDADNLADTDDACPLYAGTPEMEGCPYTGHTNTSANVRNEPSTNGTILVSIPPSATFYIIGRNTTGDWLQIVLDPDSNATIAWVYLSLVVTDADIAILPVQE